MTEIGIGLLGVGVVGGGVVELLQTNQTIISQKLDAKLVLRKASVRDLKKSRSVNLSSDILTDDPYSVVNDPNIDIICELMGGVEPAKSLIIQALNNGKHVVTANKELLAKHGPELLKLADEKNLDLHFEASVCGGIPIIQAMASSLAGNKIEAVAGIMNGTTNYILTQMSEGGTDFKSALSEAQKLGYAEADPTSDVGGHDAAYKLAVLASIAFSCHVKEDQVHREGITEILPRDIESAKDLGYAIKLLAIAKAHPEGYIEARVHPTLIPIKHPLASVSNVYNAVMVRGNFVGDVMFHGRGAGSRPTASAVAADIIDVCRNLRFSAGSRSLPLPLTEKKIIPIEDIQSKFYVRMITVDRLKGMANIANVFGNCNVSIEAVDLRPLPQERSEWMWITHQSKGSDFQNAIANIKKLPITERIISVYHVEE